MARPKKELDSKEEVRELKQMSQNLKQESEEQEQQENPENPSNHSSEEKISGFFDHLAFLRLSSIEKEILTKKIIDESSAGSLYWIEIVLSSLIATFGLLQNSVAVIIGAMLIAPLLRPIQGLAFGMTTGQTSHFWRSTTLLVKSILVSILVAYFFTMMVPLRSQTAEILARTAPNLLDLFIAIASGILALLALYYKKLSEGIAGVAMAAALMPPLAVIGIELSLENYALAWGSSFLFLTNLFAILVVGLFIFLFYGFYPHQIITQKRTIQNAIFLFLTVIVISFPLFSSLRNIADRIELKRQAESIITDTLEKTIPQAKLDRLELVEFSDRAAKLISTIKIAETEEFFLETREQIRTELGEALAREVTLEMEIIPIASIISLSEKQADEQISAADVIRQEVRKLISGAELKTTILELEVTEIMQDADEASLSTNAIESSEEEAEDTWIVKTVFTLPAGEAFDDETQYDLEANIQDQFPEEEFNFFWVPLAQKSPGTGEAEQSESEQYLNQVTLQWEGAIRDALPKGSNMENLEVSWNMISDLNAEMLNQDQWFSFKPQRISKYFVSFDLYIPEGSQNQLQAFERKIRQFARRNFKHPVDIDLRIIPFQRESYSTRPLTYEKENE